MEEEPRADDVWVAEEVIDSRGVECGRPTNEAVYLVSLPEQEFGEVAAILSGDPGDESFTRILGSHVGGISISGDQVHGIQAVASITGSRSNASETHSARQSQRVDDQANEGTGHECDDDPRLQV